MQALVDSSLIGAKRSAALQHQGDNIVWQRLDLLLRDRTDLLAHHLQHFPNS
jgi:hypothetical protein